MAENEPPADGPTTGDRTQTERLANAAQRATIGTKSDEGVDADDAADEADKTDMDAVGDDGQVFGG
jgi:hypothetical protein